MNKHEMTFYSKDNGMKTEVGFGELKISGNEEYGFRPFQLMVSSIVGCSSGVFKQILGKQRIEIEDLNVNVVVERNPDQANRIEKMSLHFVIKGKDLELDKLHKSLEVARKNCAMVQSVQDAILIEETIEVVE